MNLFKSTLLATLLFTGTSYSDNAQMTGYKGKSFAYGLCAGLVATGLVKGAAAFLSKVTGIAATSGAAKALSTTAQVGSAAILTLLAAAGNRQFIEMPSSGAVMHSIDISSFSGLVSCLLSAFLL